MKNIQTKLPVVVVHKIQIHNVLEISMEHFWKKFRFWEVFIFVQNAWSWTWRWRYEKLFRFWSGNFVQSMIFERWSNAENIYGKFSKISEKFLKKFLFSLGSFRFCLKRGGVEHFLWKYSNEIVCSCCWQNTNIHKCGKLLKEMSLLSGSFHFCLKCVELSL